MTNYEKEKQTHDLQYTKKIKNMHGFGNRKVTSNLEK